MELPRVQGKTIDFRMNKKVHRGENVLRFEKKTFNSDELQGKSESFLRQKFSRVPDQPFARN
jgi:hypothetical protein